MDDERRVWGERQRAEGGADPFERADAAESDPRRSASGVGRARAEETLPDVLRMMERKRAEARRYGRIPVPERAKSGQLEAEDAKRRADEERT